MGHTAHSLKGAVGIFAAARAFNLSLEMEQMGRAGDLARANEVYRALEAEVLGLNEELAARIQQHAPAGG